MVKIERKDTQEARDAISSLKNEKKKVSGTYNTEEVNAALQEMFAHKCYLCEQKGLSAIQIEHFRPHQGNKKLKYDWNNLFLSCAHCNNIKNDRFFPILDCTKTEVDKIIEFRCSDDMFEYAKVEITTNDEGLETKNTVNLLKEIYYGSTPQKIAEAKILRGQVAEEVEDFKKSITEYVESDGEDKIDAECLIKLKLKWNSKFAAFKRWIIRDSADKVPELLKYC